MYTKRFDEELDPDLSLEQIRGHEGVRVRNTYQLMSRRYGVKWKGRRYQRNKWDASDPANRALSMANALLNGICHAAIVSGGYSPGLGFIHIGKQLSFVYDIADLYKTELSIPIAFEPPPSAAMTLRLVCAVAAARHSKKPSCCSVFYPILMRCWICKKSRSRIMMPMVPCRVL